MADLEPPLWVKVLFKDLETHDPADRVRVSGDWIIYVTQVLLPHLAQYRRAQVAQLLDNPDWDAQRLAETIGSRTVAISRLAKEGRRARGTANDSSSGLRSEGT